MINVDMTKLKKRIRESKVPRRTKNDNLLLLTWNIAHFGKNKPKEAIAYMAEIMKRFDIIAIQEVKDDLSGIAALQKKLGKNYRFIFSDASGNSERLVFCYYKNNVKFTGLSAEVVNNPGLGAENDKKSNLKPFTQIKKNETIEVRVGNTKQKHSVHKVFEVFSKNNRIARIEIESARSSPIEKDQIYEDNDVKLKIQKFEKRYYKRGDPCNGYYLAVEYIGDKTADVIIVRQKELEFNRTPYVVSFSKNNCHFIVTSVHIFYGGKSSILFRKQELEMLASYLEERSSDADALDPDYIVCGDFNIEQAMAYESQESTKRQSDLTYTKILDSLFSALTSKGLIIPDAIRRLGTNLDRTKHYDQIGYHQYDDSTIEFVRSNVIDFVGAVFPELGDKPLDNRQTRKHLTTKLSDHLPLWAEFSIKPDNKPFEINTYRG